LLDPAEQRRELLMMGLRLAEGIDRTRFRAATGNEIETALDSARLADLAEGGFVILDAERLRATAAGRQRLNTVLAALLA
jgi:oxygen-independent coproporphyrinogen-3 oxidase